MRCKQSPIPNAQIVFTDRSANGKASIVTKNHQKVLETWETSGQRAEITAVIEAFAMFADEEFNLYSDSQYIVRLFPHIETAVLPENKTTIFHLLTKLQQQIWKRNKIFFIGHIWALASSIAVATVFLVNKSAKSLKAFKGPGNLE